jgi:hypothetical protein
LIKTLFYSKKRYDIEISEVTEMEKETPEQCTNDWCEFKGKMKEHIHCHGCGGAFYGLGFLGALVYYLTTASSLWTGFLGVIKALLWPAFLVYGALNFLGI